MTESTQRAMVVGGGLAGAAAALCLADAGVGVDLVERDDFVGGHAAALACKAGEACLSCNLCLAEPRLSRFLEHPGITIHRRSTLKTVTQSQGGFRVSLQRRPAYIDPAACSGCGACLEVCPQAAAGAIRRPRLMGDRPRLAIAAEACLHFRDQRAAPCVDACPEGAIDLGLAAEEVELPAQALVLATGFAPAPASDASRLGHGSIPDVITALELEAMLRDQGQVRRPSDGGRPQRVAFVQCVGSRRVGLRNYCSRVCCAYALRLGRMLASRWDIDVSVFYMDLQSFGHAMDDFLEATRGDLRLIRSMPADVWAGEGGGVRLNYAAPQESTVVREEFDLLVLSVGMAPGAANQDAAALLDLTLDGHGFLAGAGEGVFLAGAATGPMDLAETAAHAERAAGAALSYLEEHRDG